MTCCDWCTITNCEEKKNVKYCLFLIKTNGNLMWFFKLKNITFEWD